MNSTVIESVVLLGLQGALFFSCRKYLLRSLYSDLQALSTPKATLPSPSSANTPNDFQAHSVLARSVFALSFAESCTMFMLLMAQALDIFTPATRLLHWRISLAILMTTILVFVPMCLSLLIMGRVFLSILPVALYLVGLSQVPLPAALATTSIGAATLARLIVVGTLILGLLSGFGAMTNVWAFIPRSKTAPTDADISTADHALQTIRSDLHKRTAETPQVQGGWLTRFRGGDSQSQELQGLQALEHQMSRNLDSLRQRRDTARYARSFQGRIINFGGRIFAIYCLIRVFNSLVNILLPVARRSSPVKNNTDVITDLLAYVLSLVSPVDIELEAVASFSRQLSLGLVGLIILTNIRLVLRGVTRVLRVTSRNRGASVMLLLLAQLMGIYLLTTIVQLRTSFPPPLPILRNDPNEHVNNTTSTPPTTTPDTTNLFSTIPEFEVFGSLFDWSFVIAAGGTAFWRWGKERVDGVGDL
ncbi:Abscisic acid G-protein coupled receptor-domain-containing protein [Collybia nuda]|uniref:Abscisic acid G-protein coupled receptor-domain-containing protein n=1 Tax=Collybia nuda TaxID=64659 RepID=A0A9P6CHX0_9AGAR|nr:Abscisic acid G-protein coupled receptor-domain-containing protein [Collybia nuda]